MHRFPQLGRDPIRRRLRIAVAGLAAMLITLGLLEGTGISDVGEYLATVLRISTPHGVLVVEKEVRRFEGTGTEVFCIAISPDGRSLLAGFGPDSDSGIQDRIIDDPLHCVAILWDIEGGLEIRRLEGHRGCINDVGFSPDGRILVAASGGAYTGTPLPDGSSKKTHDNTARLWDAATGRELAVIRHQTSLASARFSPHSGILATGEFQVVHLWRIPEDLDTMASPSATTRSSSLLISSNRDGKFDLFLLAPLRDQTGTNTLFAPAAHDGWRNLTQQNSEDSGPAWSPDGERIAFCSSRSGNLDIWLMDADGSRLRQLTDYPGIDRTPCWSPDGEWIAFEGRHHNTPGTYATVYLVRTDGTEVRPITQAEAHLGFGGGRPAWRPSHHSN